MKDTGIIVSLLDQVDHISEQFVMGGYQRLADFSAPMIMAMLCLSLVLLGYGVVTGWVRLSFAEISKRVFTAGFIIMFALNWGIFSTYVYALFTQFPNQVAGELLAVLPGHHGNSGGINSALQDAWQQGIVIANAIWERGSLSAILPYIYSVAIMILIFLMTAFALLELMIAKFGLSLFLVLAPLMIAAYFFKATQFIFAGWVRNLISFSLIPIFVMATLALLLSLLSHITSTLQTAIENDTATITQLAPYLLYLFVAIGLLKRASSMATSIAGGFSTNIASLTAQKMGDLTNFEGVNATDLANKTARSSQYNYSGKKRHVQLSSVREKLL